MKFVVAADGFGKFPTSPIHGGYFYGKTESRLFKYLGCKQRFRHAVNDRIGIEPTNSSN